MDLIIFIWYSKYYYYFLYIWSNLKRFDLEQTKIIYISGRRDQDAGYQIFLAYFLGVQISSTHDWVHPHKKVFYIRVKYIGGP